MMKYEVTTELLVSVAVKVIVEADDKDDAIGKSSLLPVGGRPLGKEWKASAQIEPPESVELTVVKALWIDQASGGEKVRKV